MSQSDYALVDSLQRSPTEGKYFTALFCRYSSVVYSLIRHSARSPVQADYLFAITWRHVLNELSGIDLSGFRPKSADSQSTRAKSTQTTSAKTTSAKTTPTKTASIKTVEKAASIPEFSLQGWLVNLTAAHINQIKIPDVESIHYVLQDAPPPLWCYTERALESLSPRYRLVVLMAKTFKWSDTRISAYLQAEDEQVSPLEVQVEIRKAYRALEQAIPADIRAIYLQHPPSVAAAQGGGSMTIEFDESDRCANR